MNSSDEPTANPLPEGAPGPPGDEDLKVLLVEDNPGDARLFEEHLRESRVEAALRHEPALEAGLSALREERPGVLALDLGLPDSEGPGTVAAAVSAAPEVPIVVLTGQDDLEVALQAQQAGAAQYLQKGELTPELLGRTLRWAAQRARMQRKLRQRDAWVRSITESLSAGVFRAGPTGRIGYANEALAQMLGFEEGEELVGRDLTDFYADPDRRGSVLTEDKTGEVEIELKRDDRSVLVGLLSAKAAYGEDGRPVHYDGTITDITGRKEKEQKVRMLSEAMVQAKESVIITEAEPLEEPGPRIEYVNKAYEEMTGYSEEEVLGKTPRILQGPETDRDVLDSLRAALEAGEEWQGETVNYRKDGEPYRVQWNVSPVTDENGEIEHWVSVQRDVTEERRREGLLLQSRERYRSLFEDSNDAILVHDLEGQIQEANPQAEALLGRSAGELEGQSVHDLHPPEAQDTATEKLEVLRSGRDYEGTTRYERAGGPMFWGETSASRTEIGGETVARSLIRDVTERKQREKRLREAKEEAERMNRLKSAFLANMSHEIRTPLTSILGFAEAIGTEARGASGPEDIDLGALSQFSALIEKSGQRLMETLTSVLNLSKLEAGEMALSAGPVDLAAEAEETVGELRPQADEAGIDLHADLDGPVWAEVDEGGLRMVIRNLLSNAIKYTEKGGQVWVRARAEETLSVLEVEDTGIGMDPAETAELFEAFKQESEGTDREYEGTGLGLTLVKEILDRMDGSVEVETEKGEGSRFTVRLPRSERSSGPPSGEA